MGRSLVWRTRCSRCGGWGISASDVDRDPPRAVGDVVRHRLRAHGDVGRQPLRAHGADKARPRAECRRKSRFVGDGRYGSPTGQHEARAR